MMLTMASSNTIIQTVVDDSKRGRVMSFYAMAFMGTAPFGSLFAGAVAKVVGAPLTLAIGGAAVVAGAFCLPASFPKSRKPFFRYTGKWAFARTKALHNHNYGKYLSLFFRLLQPNINFYKLGNKIRFSSSILCKTCPITNPNRWS